MTKTLEALDNYFSWVINTMFELVSNDLTTLFNNEWAMWTVVPTIFYLMFVIAKNALFFAIIFSPVIFVKGNIVSTIVTTIIAAVKKVRS